MMYICIHCGLPAIFEWPKKNHPINHQYTLTALLFFERTVSAQQLLDGTQSV